MSLPVVCLQCEGGIAATCVRCGDPACGSCDRCCGCQQVICAACDTEPTPRFAFVPSRCAPHPHNARSSRVLPPLAVAVN